MSKLEDKQVFYSFEPDLTPLLTVRQNELFTLDTQDCFANQLTSNDDTLDSLDWGHINPATGPVAVDGAHAGDVIRFDIEKLEMIGNSVMTTIPGSGAISAITESTTCVMDNSDGMLSVSTNLGDIKLPLRPMIGVIGLVPAQGSIPNGTPGVHGGNMDCKLIGQESSLYLQAQVEGGLFGCGDAHALMGDGEVLVCGAETPARVTLSATVIHEKKLPTPFLENADLYVAIASDPTMDGAVKKAIDNMYVFLTEIVGLSQPDAGRLMSLVGNLKFCQVVDPEITIRFEFPKEVLIELGFGGIR